MADTSKKESKKTDRKAKDDILLSDSDHENLECDTCGVTFTDMKSYDSHLKGRKHQKKVSEAKLIAKHSAADDNKEDDSDEDDDEDSKDIHCDVCNKDITGYRSYLCHIKGEKHAKNMKKQKLKAQLKDMPEVLEKDDEESGTDDDDCLVKPYARCSTCEKTFTGPESFKSHMKSAVHKKKVKSSQVLQNLKAGLDDGSKQNSDDEFFSKCDVCQKSFSGHIPYKIHMSSGVHKKNVEKKKVAEEMKKFCLNEDTTEGYVCKECKKTFTDPMAFKSHLENNSHEKRKAKEQLNEFLSSHPEIVFTTPLDKEGSDESQDEEEYYLICKLCHMSFSGPESAQDHVKSKKHVSAKKDKEVRKKLKETKNTSATTSGDNSEPMKGDKLPQNGNVVNGKPKAPEKLDNHDDFEMI